MAILTPAARVTVTTAAATSGTFRLDDTDDLVVLVVNVDADAASAFTGTVTDTDGGVWTERAHADPVTTGSGNGGVAIWTRPVTTQASITVTSTLTSGFTVGASHSMQVYIVEGITGAVIGSTGIGATTTNSSTLNLFTGTGNYSALILGATDWTAPGAPTSSDFNVISTQHTAGNMSSISCYRSGGASDSGATVTGALDCGGAAAVDVQWAALEVLVGPVHGGGQRRRPRYRFGAPSRPRTRSTGSIAPVTVAGGLDYRTPPAPRPSRSRVVLPVEDLGSGDSPVADGDTSSGAETVTALIVDVAATDTVSGVDAGLVVATTSAVDVGAGADAVVSVVVPVTASDVGAGADAVTTLVVAVAAADIGAGVESTALATSRATTETGTGTDAAALVASATVTETAGGTDAAALAAASSSSDTGVGADTVQATAASAAAADTGVGVDAGSVATGGSTTVNDTDAGTSTDAAALVVNITATDTATSVDATPALGRTVSETVATIEAVLAIIVALAAADAGQGDDTGAASDTTLVYGGFTGGQGPTQAMTGAQVGAPTLTWAAVPTITITGGSNAGATIIYAPNPGPTITGS